MGWRDVLNRSPTGAEPDWRAWAEQKKWTYETPASDVARRFYPPVSEPGAGEEYPFSVRGAHGSVSFVLFARRTASDRHRAKPPPYTLHLAVQLPHTPRADLRARPAEQAFRSLGAGLAGAFRFDWHGENWLVGAGQDVEPIEVEMSLAEIDSRVALAAPDAWEAGT